MKVTTWCDQDYRKTLNISPVLMQSHKHFLVGLYTGNFYTEPLLCLEVFTPVICISRKRNRIRQKVMLLQRNAILLFDSKQNT